MCALSHVRLFVPFGLWPSRLLVYGTFQTRIVEWVVISSLRGSSQLRDQNLVSVEPPALQGDFFTAKPLGKS